MIAFTVCSNNYLAEAITLGASLKKHDFNSGNYFIFLVDEFRPEIDYQAGNFNVLKITDEIVPAFTRLKEKCNIVELSTAVKPSIFKYLLSKYKEESFFSFFDPDLYFFQNAEKFIVGEIENYSMVLTPHVTEPIPLHISPFENTFLNYGIYNLGFIALKADNNSLKMLNWWEERTLNFGIDDVKNGFFVDQLWMNLAPVFFDGVKITKHLGFNMAYWNLNERVIRKVDETYLVNEIFPLVFFHFSSFDFSLSRLSKRSYTESLSNKEGLMHLMEAYKTELTRNNYLFYKKYKPAYNLNYENYIAREIPGEKNGKRVLLIEKFKRFIPQKLLRKLANLNHIVETINKYRDV